MKEIRQKSADPAVNSLLVKAYRQKDALAWDRLDAMQPQCGFGRTALCCSECFEGPCRVNPFSDIDQETLCGRDKKDLAAGALMRRVQDGAAALMQLAAGRGAALSQGMPPVACFTADVMSTHADMAPTLADAGQKIHTILAALSEANTALGGELKPAEVTANIGVLRKDAANIVFLGHAHPEYIRRVKLAASQSDVPITLSGICGNEGRGDLALPVLTNYVSQEVPLLTGAVDLLVVGNQCVMPATLRLAGQLGVPVVQAPTGRDDAMARLAVEEAVAHFRKRAIRAEADIPDLVEPATVGVQVDEALSGAIRAAHERGQLRAVVYLAGCGSVKSTQDKSLIELARSLLAEHCLVLASGCAGAALAKAGLCAAGAGQNDASVTSPLAASHNATAGLPVSMPAVLHLGACHEAQSVIELIARLEGIPCFGTMPEFAHAKPLAVAVALASAGLPMLVGEACMPGLSAEDTGNLLIPVADFSALPNIFDDLFPN